jgi:hypothetical protein
VVSRSLGIDVTKKIKKKLNKNKNKGCLLYLLNTIGVIINPHQTQMNIPSSPSTKAIL